MRNCLARLAQRALATTTIVATSAFMLNVQGIYIESDYTFNIAPNFQRHDQ